MESIIDQTMLRNQQYKTPNNLQARMEIHRRFSRNPQPWFDWELQTLALQPGQTVVDLGCGPAELWAFHRGRLPQAVELFLCDLSLGMVTASARSLTGCPQFRYAVADAQRIPFSDGSIDLVTANHMLYHVPNIPQAVAEIRRVLKPGGRLAAATNGLAHMKELYDLIRRIIPGYRDSGDSARRFGLENGTEFMHPFFDHVETRLFEDSLWITETQPLVAYIDSMWGLWKFDQEREELLPQFAHEIDREIRQKGGFFIQKSTGMILAHS